MCKTLEERMNCHLFIRSRVGAKAKLELDLAEFFCAIIVSRNELIKVIFGFDN